MNFLNIVIFVLEYFLVHPAQSPTLYYYYSSSRGYLLQDKEALDNRFCYLLCYEWVTIDSDLDIFDLHSPTDTRQQSTRQKILHNDPRIQKNTKILTVLPPLTMPNPYTKFL